MFRLSRFLSEIRTPTPVGPRRDPPGPVVIWNLVRRCNLRCKHCYSISGDVDFPGELTTAEIFRVMDDLKAFGVPALILSGGEPLLRPDIFEISERAKALGFYVGLSSNGVLITRENIHRIADVGYDYIGISLDGIGATHDRFRGKPGAFDASMSGIRLCRERGLKVGLRFTMTMDNHHELEDLLGLAEAEHIDKFYLSHLVYAGRGNKNRADDAGWDITRRRMESLFDRGWAYLEQGRDMELVTGNNDADGVLLYLWVQRRFPGRAQHLRAKLAQWGGNASGVNVANIDNLGHVHPDTYWWHHPIGNVKERAFAEIWSDLSDPIMAGLRRRPRTISGRCGACRYFDICGGNTRVRALRLTGDPWAEDPACYLTDEEIGADAQARRLAVSPYRGARHEALRRHPA
ncbi:MAG: heme d1 biosynthesis radical SAM protein NirJ [Hyphomicrobiaceae bacterium]|nr:MAG: heme d1 biosynthesis radical SAM protein NirJ [Hyphomicrobiaceae bacterium]